MKARPSWKLSLVLAALLLPLLVGLGGCENTTPSPQERTEIHAAVMKYLHQLSDAYTNMDARRLEGAATNSEMASVQKLLEKLAASGDRIEATLLKAEIERMSVFREINATASLLEVWDVRRLDAYTGEEKGHNPGTVQHSVIQLRKISGVWLVTYRRVRETQGGSKWKVSTPTSTETGNR